MAKSFLVDINLNKNELQNAAVQNLAADPSNPIKGLMYFNTTTNRFRVFNGTTWDEMGTGGGTVTSVSAANATDGGLTISGGPITTTGTITIGHTNKLSDAQTTQSIYPITYDKNGHITGVGSAFDPSTKQNVITNLEDIKAGAALGMTSVQPADLDTYAPLASPALTGTPTAPTATAGDNTTQIATTAFVSNAISGITGAMHFKGTIGTGGSAGTALPTTGVKVGDTYKIVSEGTYAGQTAKIGDLFIATATTPTWAYVPSGDETGVTQVNTGTGLTGGPITSTGTISLATSGVAAGTYNSVTVDEYGRVTAGSNYIGLAFKMSYLITGDGTTTSFVLGNTSGSTDLTITVYDATTGEDVITDVSRTTTEITIGFAQAPATGKEYKVVVVY